MRRARVQSGGTVARHALPRFFRARGSVAHRTLDLFGITHDDGLVEFAERWDTSRLFLVAAILKVHRQGTSIRASFDDRSQSLNDDECG